MDAGEKVGSKLCIILVECSPHFNIHFASGHSNLGSQVVGRGSQVVEQGSGQTHGPGVNVDVGTVGGQSHGMDAKVGDDAGHDPHWKRHGATVSIPTGECVGLHIFGQDRMLVTSVG